MILPRRAAMNIRFAKMTWFTKALKIGAVVLLAAVILLPAPVRADSNAKQIWFAVHAGNNQFSSLQIVGNNQNNDLVIWPNGDPDPNSRPIAFTHGWWWQGSIVLAFYVSDLGWRGCSIRDLDTSVNAPYVLITYDDNYGCSGDTERTGTVKNLITDDNLNQYKNSMGPVKITGCLGSAFVGNYPMALYNCLKVVGAPFPYLPSYMQP